MKRASIIAGLTMILVLLAFSASFAFSVPERLEFDLRWLGIKAGTATMEIEEVAEGRFLIRSVARSAEWVSMFYPVEDIIESHLEGELPERYHMRLREGHRRKNREVAFMRTEGKALFIDHLKEKEKEYDIPEGIHDPLSAFYLTRKSVLTTGESVFIPVFDSKRVWNSEVKVLRKEKVTVAAGTFDAIVIKPLLKTEGIFSGKKDILIWLTDDDRRVPVKVKSKVKVGSVVAELTGGDY